MKHINTIAWIMFSVLLGSVHVFFSTDYMKPDPFPFIDFGLDSEGNQVFISFQAYIDRICDYLTWMIWLGLLAYWAPHELKLLTWTLFGLIVFDLVDYLCFYNSVWGKVGISLSMNVVKAIVLSLIILYQWIKERSAI